MKIVRSYRSTLEQKWTRLAKREAFELSIDYYIQA